jgi:hypothetical protein
MMDVLNVIAADASAVYIGGTVDVRRRWQGGHIRDKYLVGHHSHYSKIAVIGMLYGIEGHRMETRLIAFGLEKFPHKLKNKSQKSTGLGMGVNFMYVCTN